LAQNIPKSFAAGSALRTPLGELQRSPDPPAGFEGHFTAERKGGKERGKEWKRERGKRNWKRDEKRAETPVPSTVEPQLLQ